MPSPKKHLEKINRVNLDSVSRRGFLRLDKNENPGGLPEEFIQEVLSEINSEFISSYPEYGKVKEKIANHIGLKPVNISLSNGSDSSIKNIFETYISNNDNILVTDPTFAMYPIYSKIFNAQTISIPYQSLDIFPKEDFLEALDEDVKISVIVNPNNPTGSSVDISFIEEAVKKAQQYHSIVIVDEAYHYYYPETAMSLIHDYNNLIVLRSFSKMFSMASLRLGYAAANEQIVNHLQKVKPTFEVNSVAALFGAKILEREEIIDELIIEESEGKRVLAEKLREENIECKIGKANFILIKCGKRVNEIMEKLEQ
jgi:histidinol-phosphate aminotransferase